MREALTCTCRYNASGMKCMQYKIGIGVEFQIIVEGVYIQVRVPNKKGGMGIIVGWALRMPMGGGTKGGGRC